MSSIHSFTKWHLNVVLNRKHAHNSFQSSDSPPLSHLRIIQKYVNASEGVPSLHSANTLMFGDFSAVIVGFDACTYSSDNKSDWCTLLSFWDKDSALCGFSSSLSNTQNRSIHIVQTVILMWILYVFDKVNLIRSTCSMPSDWLTLVHINAFHRVHVMLFIFKFVSLIGFWANYAF